MACTEEQGNQLVGSVDDLGAAGTAVGTNKYWAGDRIALHFLLNALHLAVPPDQRVKNRQNVTAVFDHAEENVAEFWLALGIAVPLRKHRRRHFNVTAQLF